MSEPIAYGYIRVSSAEQADKHSLGNQKSRIEDYCKYKRYNMVKIYEDAGISGKDMNRPALQQLLEDAKKGNIVIVNDLSRLSRKTIDSLTMLERFNEKGIIFVCLNPEIQFDTAVGRLICSILSSISEMERENISRHTKQNLQNLSKNGKLRSRCPFGYTYETNMKDLQPDKEQQLVVDKIKNLYSSGLNYSAIARKLNEDGDNLVLKNNKVNKEKEYKFHSQTIKRILMDYGVIDNIDGRKTIAERIKCHRIIGKND